MEEKIIEIMESLFSRPLKGLDRKEIYQACIEEWDSVNHLNLIALLEDEFDTSIDLDDIVNMVSLDAILERLPS